jgi:pimeloyl-ACP methyl ester carboxylesterase
MDASQIAPQEVDGLTIGVHIAGEGEPVLLLHGWGANIVTFYPVAQRLAREGFQCHTLDLPGFGTSDLPPEPWDVPRYARFVLAYMDSAKLETVRLIGHSFGGRISLVLGADYPERVQQIVLVNSAGVRPPLTPKLQVYYFVRRWLLRLLKLPLLNRFEPGVRQWMRQKFGSEDYKTAGLLEPTFRLVIQQDLLPFARRIKAPTLLVWGSEDSETPLSSAHTLEKTIPNAGLVVFEGAGHYCYLDRLPEFVRIVAHFFKN